MRLRELISPWSADLKYIIDCSPRAVDLSPHFNLHRLEARLVRTDLAQLQPLLAGGSGGSPHPAGVLVVFLASAEESPSHSPLDAVMRSLDLLPPEARWLLLLAHDAHALPANRLVQGLGDAACHVSNVVSLNYELIRTGVLGRKDLRREGETRPLEVLRLHNEHLFARHLLRHMRGVLASESEARRSREAEIAQLRSEAESSREELAQLRRRAETDQDEVVRLRREFALHGRELAERSARVQQLERALVEAEQQKLKLREEADALLRSRRYRVGNTLVEAVAKPGRRTLRLPVELLRLWRGRGLPDAGGKPAPAAAPASLADPEIWRRMLGLERGRRSERLAVAGVLRRETARALEPDCELTLLRPNAARFGLERRHADLVIIESAVSAAGSPWATAGSFLDRARLDDLLALLRAARAQGIPVVFYWNGPPAEAPFLADLAQRCDLVVAEDERLAEHGNLPLLPRGVQVRHFHPLARNPEPAREVLFVGRPDPLCGPAAARALLDLLEHAREVGLAIYDDCDAAAPAFDLPPEFARNRKGPLAAEAAPQIYRAHALAIAPPASSRGGAIRRTRLLEQIASGLRLIAPAPLNLGPAFEAVTHVVQDGDDLARLMRDPDLSAERAAEAVPAVMRAIFREHSVASFLANLARQLGIDATFWARNFGITLLAPTSGVAQLAALAHDVLAQSVLPVKVVAGVAGDGGRESARQALSPVLERGVETAANSVPVDGASALQTLLAEVATPWTVLWPGAGAQRDRHLLEDLLLRAVCGAHNLVRGPGSPATAPLLARTQTLRDWAALADGAEQLAAAWRTGARHPPARADEALAAPVYAERRLNGRETHP